MRDALIHKTYNFYQSPKLSASMQEEVPEYMMYK